MNAEELVLKTADLTSKAKELCPEVSADLIFNAAFQLIIADEMDQQKNRPKLALANPYNGSQFDKGGH